MAASEAQGALELISRCLAGEAQAALQFQKAYGELIYGFPMRVYRTPAEDAGDFYVFAFDNGRIFRRLRTYQGRAPLRAYLLGFVLDDLVLEWKRGQHEIETVPLDAIGDVPDGASISHNGDHLEPGNPEAVPLEQVLAGVEPSKAVVMKLLFIEDCELTPREVQYLAETAERSVAEILKGIEELRAAVREREAGLKREDEALDAVQAWIQLYERRLQRIDAELAGPAPGSATAARLRGERDECERKMQRRRRQRDKLLMRTRHKKTTAPYKELAALLNTTTGNIGSQITRARRELAQTVGVQWLHRSVGETHD